ncbi:MAG TPA: orotate phosphoribosyltransferase [Polyangiaceae bacterium]|jgi:orotate phosphoribosyltransferase|nr:orotate phosphoribosyltransferase [Polyangiaceae bacterium]
MARSRRDRTENARPELLALLRTHSYRRGMVVLASGRESDFFIDCKPTVLLAEGHALVAELMLDALRNLPKCEAVAGVVLGGCSLASAVSMLSHARGRPLHALYVRKEAKDHGTRRLIEGPFRQGMKVVMLEDVITTGGSTLQAVQTLRQEGAEVVGVVVLVDRLEGGAETLAKAGLETISIYTRHDFIEEAPLSRTLSDSTLSDSSDS